MHNVLLAKPLPIIPANTVATKNTIAHVFARRVYRLANVLVRILPATQAWQDVVVLHAYFIGQKLEIYLSAPLFYALLNPYVPNGQSISEEAAQLFFDTHTAIDGLVIEQVQLHEAKLPTTKLLTLQAVAYPSLEPLPFLMGIKSSQPILWQTLVNAFERYLHSQLPSPLAKQTIALPLIAQTIDIGAHDLAALAKGDVLLLGSAGE